jgi:hypothetical protein
LTTTDLAMRSLISRIFPTFLSGFVLTAGSLAFAFVINWQLSLLLTAFASVGGFVAWTFGIFGKRRDRGREGGGGRVRECPLLRAWRFVAWIFCACGIHHGKRERGDRERGVRRENVINLLTFNREVEISRDERLRGKNVPLVVR